MRIENTTQQSNKGGKRLLKWLSIGINQSREVCQFVVNSFTKQQPLLQLSLSWITREMKVKLEITWY